MTLVLICPSGSSNVVLVPVARDEVTHCYPFLSIAQYIYTIIDPLQFPRLVTGKNSQITSKTLINRLGSGQSRICGLWEIEPCFRLGLSIWQYKCVSVKNKCVYGSSNITCIKFFFLYVKFSLCKRLSRREGLIAIPLPIKMKSFFVSFYENKRNLDNKRRALNLVL